LLSHARRALVIREEDRARIFSTKTPQSFPTFLVDGAVAGVWRTELAGRKATIVLEPYEPLPRAAQRELRDEAARLVTFVEPEAASYAVRIQP
jgi:hypothetical protein